MSTLCLIRHGQASFGTDHYDRLSERGFIQSELLARYLLKIDQKFDTIYAGEMKRQIDTAEKVLSCCREAGRAVPALQILPEFNEYDSKGILKALVRDLAKDDPGMEGDMALFYKDKKAFQRIFEKVILRWITGGKEIPGVISWQEFRERVARGMRKVMADNGRGKAVLVFTSGGPISAAFQMATGISDEGTLRVVWHIVNTSVSSFIYNAEQISMTSFNNRAHLDLEKNSSLVTYR
ncbi:MAG TPA: histidine phosphatase family protein [Syntrophus sp. (in: bacteria)]|jgi:broad specificity phosphatase PhoE|nr:histidine phosphatase family protein [Syntrophus sp. (in: bacteria)]